MALTDNPGGPPNQTDEDLASTEEAAPEIGPGEVTDLAALQNKLAEKTKEAQEYYDRLLRCAAEMENLKKRQEKERAELVQFANENLCKDLLPVLDNLERALEHGRQFEAPAAMIEGLELVHQNFLKTLEKYGVTPLESVGQQFDPAFHHAVMEEEAPELADQTVAKELQKGYLMHTRLLRPAMVVVSRNKETQSSQEKVDLKV
ncbi:MAG: nucleotide exchange factor GrpE [Deltaproteobacteria bacterium]|nr:nucleotide exchange factor GrpE [Deltaproteobacteria bacterium]